jgi:phosphodiesterase/alkaline phosphatase D-like protein
MKWKLICSVLLAVCLILPAVPAMADAASTKVSGTVPLVIYDVSGSATGCNSATILWKTNGAASSQVFYDTKFHGNIADYAFQTPNDSTLVIAHSVKLTGLSPATTYHYRAKSVVVVNGTVFTAISEDYTFTTLPVAHVPPSVFTVTAWPVGPKSAVVWGWLTDMRGASSVKVYFQWGKTTDYGSQTGQQTMKHPGIFVAIITGLTPRTRYHFRAVAVGDGTSYGWDESFTTSKW